MVPKWRLSSRILWLVGVFFIGGLTVWHSDQHIRKPVSTANETVRDSNPSVSSIGYPPGKLPRGSNVRESGQSGDTPSTQCVVPRIPSLIHLVWMTRKQNESMKFHHFISFLSVMKRIRPSQIRFYYDNLPIGQYWDEILNLVNKTSTATLMLIKTENPRFIGGKEIKVNEHGSDVVRLDMIRQYGGIYLDLDVHHYPRSDVTDVL